MTAFQRIEFCVVWGVTFERKNDGIDGKPTKAGPYQRHGAWAKCRVRAYWRNFEDSEVEVKRIEQIILSAL